MRSTVRIPKGGRRRSARAIQIRQTWDGPMQLTMSSVWRGSVAASILVFGSVPCVVTLREVPVHPKR